MSSIRRILAFRVAAFFFALPARAADRILQLQNPPQTLLKKSENDLARNSRICPARGVEDAGWPREPMTLVAESDR